MSHIVCDYITILLHNALVFQVTEWFVKVTVRFFVIIWEIHVCHLQQIFNRCCSRHDIKMLRITQLAKSEMCGGSGQLETFLIHIMLN